MSRALQIAATSLALSLLGGVAAAADQAAGTAGQKTREPSIPFADHGGIRNWEADKDVGIWVQDTHRHWYYATFMSPCHELRFVEGVGFATGPGGQLDRFSAVRTRGGERCVFASFEDSKGPPPGKKAKKPAPEVSKDPGKDAPADPAPPKPAG